MTKNLQDLRAEAREDFLATFKCIDSSCDQNGCVPHQISDDEWEAQQCQYCWEIRFPAADKLNTLIDSVLLHAQSCENARRYWDEKTKKMLALTLTMKSSLPTSPI